MSMSIEETRKKIDCLDEQIVVLLSARERLIMDVIVAKKESGHPVYDPSREEEIIQRLRQRASSLGGNPDMVESVYRTIFEYSKRKQNEEMSG